MKKDPDPVNRFARSFIAGIVKKVRLLTHVIDDQNKLLEDWKKSLRHSAYRPSLPQFADVVEDWKEEAVAAIKEFATSQAAGIEDPIDRECAESELTLQVIRALQIETSHIVARRCVSNMQKVLAAGATVGITAGLFYTACKLLKDGEKGETAVKRAQAQEEESEVKPAPPQS